jgi:V-type H+-transporting ATPase subunit a
MHMVQLFVQTEAAHDTVDEMGKLGIVEFVDLNPNVNVFHRCVEREKKKKKKKNSSIFFCVNSQFVRDVRRMEELGRKLRYFQSEIKASGIKPRAVKADDNGREKPLVIEEMETQLDDLEHDLRDVTRTYATLNRDASELIELKLVLENTADIFTKDAPAAQDALRNDEEAAMRARASASTSARRSPAAAPASSSSSRRRVRRSRASSSASWPA